MDKEAARDFYLEHWFEIPQGIREFQPEGTKVEGRCDTLVADLVDVPFDGVKTVHRNTGDVSCSVVHAQNESAVVSVRKRRQLVGESISSRSGNPVASELHGLELK